ncbi:uncharacterized protein LOC106753163 isoform X2 [Vigna radiata var. radiata]|uniref:Uncharacterized protein LOC106753163 isoform X2 n=1 Tax=Vigna radiata var. radiata TaxID=3916 RepID=A0A3Q0ENB0_VIGRR|nr:uncharacterized protein LOC106753163 isoform X2 [Vigna radiata var. radiata]
MAYEEQSEHEVISAFLGLLSSATRLHVIHIVAEMAPVPKAVEFARKLAEKHLFRHVTVENLFEDGNHLYRVLDDDLIVVSQCHNISRGISTLKPKPLAENCVKTKVSVQCNI